jgi:hypothetical protein
MNGASKNWWEDPQTDWTSGEAAKFVELLVRAYPEPGAIRALAGSVGLDAGAAVSGTPAREAWLAVLLDATGRRRVLDLAAAVIHDPASSAFHSLLVLLLGERAADALARVATLHGSPADAEASARELQNLVAVAAERTEDPEGRLEAILSPASALLDADAAARVLPTAQRRTALIEVGGRPMGTGFLVGPNLVVTAAHVIDPLRFPPVPPPGAFAVFDFVQQGRTLAETGTRVPVVDFVDGSLPTRREVDGTLKEWDVPDTRLDYALLKLKSAVPDHPESGPRGAYAPDPTEYDFDARQVFFIVQQPLGDVQKVDYISDRIELNGRRTRIRYRGNTLPGSSGSPILDTRGRLVALHHYSTRGRNQAVPFSMIASKLLNGEHAELFAEAATGEAAPAEADRAPARARLDPWSTTELMGRPFVDRAHLRDSVREIAKRDQPYRTLAIWGLSGSGVSYSYNFATHIAAHSADDPELSAEAPEGLVAVKIDLRQYVGTKVEERRARIAASLLVQLGLQESPDPLSQEATDTTLLAARVGAGLRDSKKQWWIFIDSIDDMVAVKQGDVHELIRALVEMAEGSQVPVRLVLAGREAEQFAVEHTGWLREDRAAGLVRGEVERWVRTRAAEDGRIVDEAKLASALDDFFPPDGRLPDPRRLAPKLPKAYLDITNGRVNGS